MDIIHEIEEVLISYQDETKEEQPTRLLLGRRQLEAFDCKYGPYIARTASPGPSRAYGGIPIVATEASDQLDAE